MSIEQRLAYLVPHVELTSVLSVAIFSSFAIIGVIALYQSFEKLGLFDRMYRDGTTGLYNKAFFLEARKKLEDQSDDPLDGSTYLFLSMDIQGFKAVNDNINHEVGDEALKLWGDTCKTKAVNNDTCTYQIFRPGGDEIALICQKRPAASEANFKEEVLEVVQALAKVSHIITGEGPSGEAASVPTFLRVGAGPTFDLADKAETAIRSRIYMAAFGSLDARGQMVAMSNPKLDGIRNWEVTWLGQDASTTASTTAARSAAMALAPAPAAEPLSLPSSSRSLPVLMVPPHKLADDGHTQTQPASPSSELLRNLAASVQGLFSPTPAVSNPLPSESATGRQPSEPNTSAPSAATPSAPASPLKTDRVDLVSSQGHSGGPQGSPPNASPKTGEVKAGIELFA